MKQPSIERGCQFKAKLGSIDYKSSADKLAAKHGKRYGVYRCPHCNNAHLTTKLDNDSLLKYPPLLYVTP